MIEHINVIDTLSDQIRALLDLMAMAETSVSVISINTAAEMCQTMLVELMVEVEKIEAEWRVSLEDDGK